MLLALSLCLWMAYVLEHAHELHRTSGLAKPSRIEVMPPRPTFEREDEHSRLKVRVGLFN